MSSCSSEIKKKPPAVLCPVFCTDRRLVHYNSGHLAQTRYNIYIVRVTLFHFSLALAYAYSPYITLAYVILFTLSIDWTNLHFHSALNLLQRQQSLPFGFGFNFYIANRIHTYYARTTCCRCHRRSLHPPLALRRRLAPPATTRVKPSLIHGSLRTIHELFSYFFIYLFIFILFYLFYFLFFFSILLVSLYFIFYYICIYIHICNDTPNKILIRHVVTTSKKLRQLIFLQI